jgi:ribosome-associated protein
MSMIRLTDRTAVPEDAISEHYTRASGPGGQNVNKVATAVQLRLDLERAGLPRDVRQRLEGLAGRRLTRAGEIVIEAQRFRTRERNREDALARLAALVASAESTPKARVPTPVPRVARRRRVDDKTRHGARKRLRARPEPGE